MIGDFQAKRLSIASPLDAELEELSAGIHFRLLTRLQNAGRVPFGELDILEFAALGRFSGL